MVITQHIPRAFSAQFAARLDACSQLSVQRGAGRGADPSGPRLIAPGDLHLTVVRDGARYRCRLRDERRSTITARASTCCFARLPSRSAANAVGVILTGMGADGARRVEEMREPGALHRCAGREKQRGVGHARRRGGAGRGRAHPADRGRSRQSLVGPGMIGAIGRRALRREAEQNRVPRHQVLRAAAETLCCHGQGSPGYCGPCRTRRDVSNVAQFAPATRPIQLEMHP